MQLYLRRRHRAEQFPHLPQGIDFLTARSAVGQMRLDGLPFFVGEIAVKEGRQVVANVGAVHGLPPLSPPCKGGELSGRPASCRCVGCSSSSQGRSRSRSRSSAAAKRDFSVVAGTSSTRAISAKLISS